MINLSAESEALAHRLAEVQHVSVEEAVRLALEACALASGLAPQAWKPRDTSPAAVAARIARFDEMALRVAAAPINDPRPVSEIVDDLNAL